MINSKNIVDFTEDELNKLSIGSLEMILSSEIDSRLISAFEDGYPVFYQQQKCQPIIENNTVVLVFESGEIIALSGRHRDKVCFTQAPMVLDAKESLRYIFSDAIYLYYMKLLEAREKDIEEMNQKQLEKEEFALYKELEAKYKGRSL
jgi:hypothetical protein